MPLLKKEKSNKNNNLPYEKQEKLTSLILYVIIVNRGQGHYYLDELNKLGVSFSSLIYGYSNPPEEIIALFGNLETKKDLIFTIFRKELLPHVRDLIQKRFIISKQAKGVAFGIPIDSVAGVIIYKFLADQNKNIRENNNGK